MAPLGEQVTWGQGVNLHTHVGCKSGDDGFICNNISLFDSCLATGGLLGVLCGARNVEIKWELLVGCGVPPPPPLSHSLFGRGGLVSLCCHT